MAPVPSTILLLATILAAALLPSARAGTISCSDGSKIVELAGTGSLNEGIITSLTMKCGSAASSSITGAHRIAIVQHSQRLKPFISYLSF